MARAIWTGSVAFGLVNVPVALFSATEDKTIHFNQFQEGTSDRIRYKRVNERTGREVPLERIVRGHEVADGNYVLVGDDELEAVEPGRSRTIDISDFVELADIDPIYYQKTYYLAPQGDEAAARAYALLHRAMADTGRAGIATFVFHGKQYLVAIRPRSEVLALQTMYFADEVRDPADVIDDLLAGQKIASRELTIAKQLIDSMTAAWDPEQYTDSYRERVEDLIARKGRGEEIVREGEPAGESNVTDLMEALRQSAEQMRGRRASGSQGGTAPRGKAATRKTSSARKSGSPRKSGSAGTSGSADKKPSAAKAGGRSRRKAS